MRHPPLLLLLATAAVMTAEDGPAAPGINPDPAPAVSPAAQPEPAPVAAAPRRAAADLRLLLGTYAAFDQVSYVRSEDTEKPTYLISNGLGRGIELQVVSTDLRTPVSGYLMIGATARIARGEDETGKRHHVLSGGLLLGGGLSFRPHPDLALEIGPTVTLGYTDNQGDDGDDDGDGVPNDEEPGYKRPPERSTLYLAADARAGLWWTHDHLQVGGVVGIAAQTRSSHREFSVGGKTEDIDFSGSGTFVMAGIGCRF